MVSVHSPCPGQCAAAAASSRPPQRCPGGGSGPVALQHGA